MIVRTSARTPSSRVPRLNGERVDFEVGGLAVCVVEQPGVPVVGVALCYGTGTAAERDDEGGVAHFLEHMMFKGSRRFGEGEVDSLTQRLGGSNNAFTSHDATVYHFSFGTDTWSTALEIESDRMDNLLLDEDAIESERHVILEEIAMYEDEPWDALDQQVVARVFAGHPYAKPVLGSRSSVEGLSREALRAFYSQYYNRERANLAVVGGVRADEVRAACERWFGNEPSRSRSGALPDTETLPTSVDGGPIRIERQHGELARLLVAFPAPAVDTDEHAAMRLLLAGLCLGRGSRLHRRLVEQERSCLWVTSDLTEGRGPSCASIALEVTPGFDSKDVELAVLDELSRSVSEPLTQTEIERARQLLRVDYVFSQQRVEARAVNTALEHALYGEGHHERCLDRLLSVDPCQFRELERWLRPDRAVIGWSLPSVS